VFANHSSRDPVSGKPVVEPSPPSRVKPSKPYPGFPLYAHASGQWAKKIRGRFYYFGPWHDPDGSLSMYLDQKDDLHAGRTPRPDPQALTMKNLANACLNHKQALLTTGELSPRTWVEYRATTDLLIESFGKNRLVSDLRTDDFAAMRKCTRGWAPGQIRHGPSRRHFDAS
jgi:hypothetical protein